MYKKQNKKNWMIIMRNDIYSLSIINRFSILHVADSECEKRFCRCYIYMPSLTHKA